MTIPATYTRSPLPVGLLAEGKRYTNLGRLRGFFNQVDILGWQETQSEMETYGVSADRIVKCRYPKNNPDDDRLYLFSVPEAGYYWDSINAYPIRCKNIMLDQVDKVVPSDRDSLVNIDEVKKASEYLTSPMALAMAKAWLEANDPGKIR